MRFLWRLNARRVEAYYIAMVCKRDIERLGARVAQQVLRTRRPSIRFVTGTVDQMGSGTVASGMNRYTDLPVRKLFQPLNPESETLPIGGRARYVTMRDGRQYSVTS